MKLQGLVKKTVITTIVVISSLSGTSAHAAYNMLTTVPHVFEFGSENPRGYDRAYYWCGHSALKIAMQYKAGTNKTLSQIHDIFLKNSAGYRANTYCGTQNPGKSWCASLQDLMWAAAESKNGGYGRGYSNPQITIYNSASDMYTKIKTQINAGNPVIIPTEKLAYTPGHFWVIVGYSDGYNDATNTIYVRDVAMSSPTNAQYDRTFFAPEFFNASLGKQGLTIK
jgi:Peptidase_C39 like family